MTIIAYRDGVIASDSQVTDDDLRMGEARKIALRNGCELAGAVGYSSHCQRFLNWFLGVTERPILERVEDKEFVGFIVDADGLWIYDESLERELIRAPFIALGSGAAVALGAMEMGATAVQAAEAAVKYNIDCGGRVVRIDLANLRRLENLN